MFKILVGPEEPGRLQAIQAGVAPRLDYRVVADQLDGAITQGHVAPAALRGAKFYRVLRSLAANTRFAAQVLGSMPQESIVFSTGETWGLPIAVCSRLMRRRRYHHIMYVHRVFSRSWLWLVRGLGGLLHVDGWICPTQYQAGRLRTVIKADAAKLTVVPQGVDTWFFDPPRASHLNRPPYILSVGTEMRNYPLLFAAARHLDIQVVIKASSSWMAGIRQKPMAEPPKNVALLTERLSYSELRDLYADAQLVVAPVYDTPQAAGITTIFEAMAMAKCVVATRSRGLPDAFVDGRNGIIVEPDTCQFAEAINHSLKSAERTAYLATAALRTARNEVSLEAYAEGVIHFIQATVQAKGTTDS